MTYSIQVIRHVDLTMLNCCF